MTRISTDWKARTAIYREAARLIERGESDERNIGVRACFAIDQAAERRKSAARSAYVKHVLGGCSASAWLYEGYEDSPEANDERIVALCFMAALVEAGDA